MYREYQNRFNKYAGEVRIVAYNLSDPICTVREHVGD